MVGISRPTQQIQQIQSCIYPILEEGTQVFNLDLNKGATEAIFVLRPWGWRCPGWYPNWYQDGLSFLQGYTFLMDKNCSSAVWMLENQFFFVWLLFAKQLSTAWDSRWWLQIGFSCKAVGLVLGRFNWDPFLFGATYGNYCYNWTYYLHEQWQNLISWFWQWHCYQLEGIRWNSY